VTSWRLGIEDLKRHGERTALTGLAAAQSYRALASRAEAVASSLRDAGVAPGDPVALVSSGRAHDEPVALAGVLASGAIAVPLDASAPPLRLAEIVRDRGCRALVHDEGFSLFETDLARIELDRDGFVLATLGQAPAPRVPPDLTMACILHTSGSTGKPKAIPIRWEGLDAFTAWMVELTALTSEDRVLRVAELVFDLAWFDHVASWRAGATLCTMSRRDMAAAGSLTARFRELAPSVVYAVPAFWMKLTAFDETLRIICFAGEVFPPRELRALASAAPNARLFNLFGPTETNVCTYYEVDRARLDGTSELPIGVACPYADCRLVDGELIVRGPTAMDGEVATRDRVERGADGLFYFRGRIDRMVKIRGFRVDPGEVEAALVDHDAIREAAVDVIEHPKLGKTLRAFVTVRSPVEPRALRMHLANRLPSYMVPDKITLLEELPRTTTGKIDYASLR
jgi:acyl-coenzyme A synthetase/AMP-(fatty) acid ligase